MGGTGVATLVRSGVLGTDQAHLKPLGLGSSTLPHQPLGACPRGTRSLRRQWTTAKPHGGDVSCNVLPFFLDLSLAFAPGVEFFDAVKSSVDSEVVFQATLQVPAHHALACRLNAYGTPFAAPDLQAAAHELRDEDLEFAACLATPPDLDEQLSVNFGRVMSMLEKNQGQGGAQIATRAAPARPAAGPSANVQQQLRATNQQAGQTAPKVLVSVDEAETTAAQLQRQNSGKKQPKLQSMMDGYGKRALQALLGLGYLLTVLHEKSLGGHIQFTAGLTAANIISPTTSDDHHAKSRRTSGGLGVLAGLRSFMRECPSLSPLSPNNSMNGRQQVAAAAAAAVAAADGAAGSGSIGSADGSSGTPKRLSMAASFEAAWDRVLHPHLVNSVGGGSRAGAIPACRGLQLQLSLSAPCRRMSMDWSGTSGSTPRAPISPVGSSQQQQQQGQQEGPFAAATAAATHKGSPLAQGSAGAMQGAWQQQQQQQDLHKTGDIGRGDMDAIIDSAIEQLQEQRQEASATDLVSMVEEGHSVFEQAAGQPVADSAVDSTPPCTPIRPKPPLPPKQQQQQQQQQQPVTPGSGVRSFYLSDQGPLTSPLCPPWAASAGGGLGMLQPPAPFGNPQASAASAAGKDDQSAAGSSSMPGTPGRMLLPVMSMRLTCQPAWQYSDSTAGTANGGDIGSTVNTAGCPKTAATPGSTNQGQTDGAHRNGVTQTIGMAAVAEPPATAAAAADVSKPSLTLASFIAAADGAKRDNSSSSARSPRKSAVHMHQPTQEELRARVLEKQQQQQQSDADGAAEDQDVFDGSALMGSPIPYSLPQGLWPTMSFSLVPVRFTPTSPRNKQSTSNVTCIPEGQLA